MQFNPLDSPNQPNHKHTLDQRRLRRRIGGQSLRQGVRLAVKAMFGFTHRAEVGEALWSRREHVWLGRATFLHWAMHDAAVDIPWLAWIPTAAQSPKD